MNRVLLFGGATVWVNDRPLVGRAAQRHRLALLALLATTRRTGRSREALVALLWPDADSDRGRRLLSDSVYRINGALGGDALVGIGHELRIDERRLTSDVAELETASDANDWRRAVGCYRGPFLDGFFLDGSVEFDQWMESERRTYASIVCRGLEALAREAAGGNRLVEAVDWWERLATLVPDDSRVAVALMRALEAAGNRAGAVRHARAHAELLRDELGVEPDPSVVELADRIAGRSVEIDGRHSMYARVVIGSERRAHRETLRSAGGV